jgi:predicted ATP-grasp superfamily ATP-dependent carboligase
MAGLKGLAAPALVLGTGVTSLGVTRALAAAGIRSFAAHDRPEHLRHSRHHRPPRGIAPLEPGQSLAEWLAAWPGESAVLFPCSDGTVREVAGLPESLGARFATVVPTASVLDQVVDKGAFAACLERAAIPHPFTHLVTGPEDLDLVPDAVFDSAFLKPRESQRFFARYGVKGFAVASRDDAGARLRDFVDAGATMVLQEYIPGGADAHYFIDGYVDRAGSVRALFVRRRLRMFPRDFGNSSYMVSVAPEEAPDGVATVRRLLAALGYRGIYSVELKRDPRDRRFKVIELNARPWWYVEFAAQCGVNVCQLMYRDALGLPLEDLDGYRTGRTLMYPPYDLSAVRPFGREGHPSWLRWMVQLLQADQPIWCWNDPVPGFYEVLEWVLPALGIRFGGKG